MNVFSTPEFLETAADVFFPGQPRSIEVFRIDGRLLRLLVINGRVVERMPFYDFPQPLEGWTSAAKDRWFFPRTVLKTTTVAERVEPEPPGLQPSPYIDWSLFADEQAFQAHVAASPTLKSNDPARQRRKLEHDTTHSRVIGPVGAPPAGWLVERLLRRNTKAVLERYPKALQLARTIKRTLGQ